MLTKLLGTLQDVAKTVEKPFVEAGGQLSEFAYDIVVQRAQKDHIYRNIDLARKTTTDDTYVLFDENLGMKQWDYQQGVLGRNTTSEINLLYTLSSLLTSTPFSSTIRVLKFKAQKLLQGFSTEDLYQFDRFLTSSASRLCVDQHTYLWSRAMSDSDGAVVNITSLLSSASNNLDIYPVLCSIEDLDRDLVLNSAAADFTEILANKVADGWRTFFEATHLLFIFGFDNPELRNWYRMTSAAFDKYVELNISYPGVEPYEDPEVWSADVLRARNVLYTVSTGHYSYADVRWLAEFFAYNMHHLWV